MHRYACALAAKITELGVSLSFSSPRLSNDNSITGSFFLAMKYHQSDPSRGFRDLLSVRAWAESFVDWYNSEHRHSGINDVTFNQPHYGEADEIWRIRQETYEQARLKSPRCWTRVTRDCSQPQVVRVNHLRPQKQPATSTSASQATQGSVWSACKRRSELITRPGPAAPTSAKSSRH